MKRANVFVWIVLCALLLALAGSVGAQEPEPQGVLGTAFTYQGRLEDGGSPADGSYDLRFRLFDAASGGTQVGGAVGLEDVAVVDGLFTAVLDFGASAFAGEARYLEAAVRPGSSTGSYTALSPRQALTAAPYALHAAQSPWSGLSGVPAGFADGADADALGALSCSNGQVAKWNGTTWTCGNDAGGTAYTAGTGLVLSSSQFSINTPYRLPQACSNGNTASWNGTAWVCTARADHNHLGQTWTGSDNPLKIEGSFGSPDSAPLVLSNSHGYGLRIASARADGVRVESAINNGVSVIEAGGYGVYVSSAFEDGVYVSSAGDDGVVVGSAGGDGVYVASAGGYGVYARSTNANYYGGHFRNTAGGGTGLRAEGGGDDAADIILDGSTGRLSGDPDYASSDLYFDSNDDVFVRLDQDGDEGGYFRVRNQAGGDVFLVDEAGNMTAFGSKSAVVDAGEHGWVKLYAVESAENWFEDLGTASLDRGAAVVDIDPVFGATVNLEQGYHVFVTPLGDCGLYVADKTAVSFTVRALGGATCSVEFDYRIVARRLGYEDVRLEPADVGQEEGE